MTQRRPGSGGPHDPGHLLPGHGLRPAARGRRPDRHGHRRANRRDDDKAIGQSPLEDAYRRLCGLAKRSSKRNEGQRVSRNSTEPIRSAAARRAILLRSKGNCENPDCIGHPDVLTDAGDPILEIDHIHDLAKDGPDDPIEMIALCPNCHAVKTRGRDREQLRQRLFDVARQRHQDLIKAPRRNLIDRRTRVRGICQCRRYCRALQ